MSNNILTNEEHQPHTSIDNNEVAPMDIYNINTLVDHDDMTHAESLESYNAAYDAAVAKLDPTDDNDALILAELANDVDHCDDYREGRSVQLDADYSFMPAITQDPMLSNLTEVKQPASNGVIYNVRKEARWSEGEQAVVHAGAELATPAAHRSPVADVLTNDGHSVAPYQLPTIGQSSHWLHMDRNDDTAAVYKVGVRFDADKLARSEKARNKAAHKRALPYLYKDNGQLRSLKSKQGFNAARKAMLATLEK